MSARNISNEMMMRCDNLHPPLAIGVSLSIRMLDATTLKRTTYVCPPNQALKISAGSHFQAVEDRAQNDWPEVDVVVKSSPSLRHSWLGYGSASDPLIALTPVYFTFPDISLVDDSICCS